MTRHDAKAARRGDGWSRWSASCPCGWTAEARGKTSAEHKAAAHRNLHAALAIVESELYCSCFVSDGADVEFTDTCPKHRLIELLGGAV